MPVSESHLQGLQSVFTAISNNLCGSNYNVWQLKGIFPGGFTQHSQHIIYITYIAYSFCHNIFNTQSIYNDLTPLKAQLKIFFLFSYMWQCVETRCGSWFQSLDCVWCSSVSAGNNHQVWGQHTLDRPWPKDDRLLYTDSLHALTHHCHTQNVRPLTSPCILHKTVIFSQSCLQKCLYMNEYTHISTDVTVSSYHTIAG